MESNPCQEINLKIFSSRPGSALTEVSAQLNLQIMKCEGLGQGMWHGHLRQCLCFSVPSSVTPISISYIKFHNHTILIPVTFIVSPSPNCPSKPRGTFLGFIPRHPPSLRSQLKSTTAGQQQPVTQWSVLPSEGANHTLRGFLFQKPHMDFTSVRGLTASGSFGTQPLKVWLRNPLENRHWTFEIFFFWKEKTRKTKADAGWKPTAAQNRFRVSVLPPWFSRKRKRYLPICEKAFGCGACNTAGRSTLRCCSFGFWLGRPARTKVFQEL